MNKQRVAVYLYTNDQESVDAGRMKDHFIRRLAADEGKQLVGFYEDCCITRCKERPVLNRLLADAEKGEFSLVLVRDISRFSRDHQKAREICRRLAKAGVEVEFEKEGRYDEKMENFFTAVDNLTPPEPVQPTEGSANEVLKYLEHDLNHSAAHDDISWSLVVGDFRVEVPLDCDTYDILVETLKRLCALDE